MSTGYRRYNKRIPRGNGPNFNEISDRFQQNIKKYLLDMTKYLPDIRGQSSESEKFEKSHVLTEFNSRISTEYQPDIKASCTPDIMSCHTLRKSKHSYHNLTI